MIFIQIVCFFLVACLALFVLYGSAAWLTHWWKRPPSNPARRPPPSGRDTLIGWALFIGVIALAVGLS